MRQMTNEEKLDLLADLIEPVAEIFGDPVVAGLYRSGGRKIDIVKAAIKGHKKAVIEVLALTDGVDPSEYEINLLALPVKLARLLESPELQELSELFTSQGKTISAASSGSVTVNIEDGAR